MCEPTSLLSAKELVQYSWVDTPGKKRIDDQIQSIWTVFFKEEAIFQLKATYGSYRRLENGITVIPVVSYLSLENLKDFEWKYKNQFQIDPKKPLLNIKEICRDKRGIISAVEYCGHEIFSLLATHKGYARGGHFHPYDVRLTMPIGKGEWHLQQGNHPERVIKQKAGDNLTIGKSVIHYVIAKEDLLLKETPLDKVETFLAINDPESRKVIEEINQ